MKTALLVLFSWLCISLSAYATVNINTAKQTELESLPGIGPVKAKANKAIVVTSKPIARNVASNKAELIKAASSKPAPKQSGAIKPQPQQVKALVKKDQPRKP